MKHSRIFLFFVVGMALALFVAACGSSSTGSGPYGGSNSGGQTPTSAPTSATTIKTATMTVNGKSVTVLTNAQGLTLYYRTSDTPSSVCSSSCASIWPPILSTTLPSASTTLPGTLSLINDANGSQVAYNGHPLYTYSGDTASGQAKGEGFKGVWFVATTDLTGSITPTPATTPTTGGYGG
ncbi:MAG: hypothetical protein NVS3B14_14640 [Ktedonobacteraceae bacterium]